VPPSGEPQFLGVPPGPADRKSPSEGSRPGTPGSASTREALAKLVNNRMQVGAHVTYIIPGSYTSAKNV